MEKDLDYIAFQLAQSERKIAALDEKIAFLNKLLVVVAIAMIFIFINT